MRKIALRQTTNRLSKQTLAQQGRYAHGKQLEHARRCTKKLLAYLGCVIREIEIKFPKATRIRNQEKKDESKIYSVHEPAVECVRNGIARKRYGLGSKVSVASTSRCGWIVGGRALQGNPYEGHKLMDAIAQVEETARRSEHVFDVDMGYRVHGYTGKVDVPVDKPRPDWTAKSPWNWMKRRTAVEPGIGHLKQKDRIDRNRLKGTVGDRIKAIFSAAGMNFHKLVRLAEGFLRLIFFCLQIYQRAWT